MSAGTPRVVLGCDFFLKYTVGLASGLADIGCEAMLVSRDHDLEFGCEQDAMRRWTASTLGGAVTHELVRGRVRERLGLASTRQVRQKVARFAPQACHLQDSVANDPRIAVAARAWPHRYALTVHDPEPHPGDRQPSAARRASRRALIRGAGLLFAHADKLADDLRRLYSPRAPVVVVPHGAGPARRSPLPARPSLLFFGRMSFYKGLDVLLDAMPLIWRAKPDVALTVAGEGELPAHPVLADQRVEVEARHVPEAEIPALFAAASCVVLPYRQASQSGVGSLAKQYGRAVVASSVGGLPQLVGPGHGRLVPPGDVHALAQAVVELLGDPVLLEEMGAAAAAALDNGTGWRQVAEATVDAYERLLPPLTTPSKSRA